MKFNINPVVISVLLIVVVGFGFGLGYFPKKYSTGLRIPDTENLPESRFSKVSQREDNLNPEFKFKLIGLSPIVILDKSLEKDRNIKIKSVIQFRNSASEEFKTKKIEFSIPPLSYILKGKDSNIFYKEILADGTTWYSLDLAFPDVMFNKNIKMEIADNNPLIVDRLSKITANNPVDIDNLLYSSETKYIDLDQYFMVVSITKLDNR